MQDRVKSQHSYMLICTCSQMPEKLSHDGWRTLRGSQRRLSPNEAQFPGMAALMIGKLHARFAENASARWCRAKGAACQNISSSYAQARIAERLGGSERDTVLRLAKASVPRPRLLQLSSPVSATRKTIEISSPDIASEVRMSVMHQVSEKESEVQRLLHRCLRKPLLPFPSASHMDAIHAHFTLCVHLAAVCTRCMSCQSAS